jgi:hypothetical protein
MSALFIRHSGIASDDALVVADIITKGVEPQLSRSGRESLVVNACLDSAAKQKVDVLHCHRLALHNCKFCDAATFLQVELLTL